MAAPLHSIREETHTKMVRLDKKFVVPCSIPLFWILGNPAWAAIDPTARWQFIAAPPTANRPTAAPQSTPTGGARPGTAAPIPPGQPANGGQLGGAGQPDLSGVSPVPSNPANITPTLPPIGGSGAVPPGSEIPNPLAVEEAVRIGMERNPQAAAGIAGVASAAATYRSTASFPPVNLNLTAVRGSSAAPTLNGTTSDTFVDLGDTLDTSGQRRYQAAGAKANLGVAQYQLEETKLSLAQQIRDAYWSLAGARAQKDFGLESLREVQHVNQLTRLQLAAGSSPRGDVVRSSIDVANAQQNYLAAQGAERAALSGLNVLLARAPQGPIQLADNLSQVTVIPTLSGNLPDLETITRFAMTNRPAVRAALAQVRAADFALKQARSGRFPDFSVDYERSVRDPTQAVVVALHMPLLDFGTVRNSIAAAAAAKRQAEAQQKASDQQVAQQVAQAYTDYTQAQQLSGSFQTDILAPSTTLLAMAQLGYKQGATGILPVIDAETTLRNARTSYINSLLALYKAQDEITAAIGGPLPPATVTLKPTMTRVNLR